MKYIVAVSGGVDSVVLLDMLSRGRDTLIVAHVDHGIRGQDSAADARFVQQLARRYGVPYVSTDLHLGANASELAARRGRYEFLQQQAAEHGVTIVTAHHHDDMIETIAINLQRGTGWRGLAVMGRSDVLRPLIGYTKQQLYDYAVRHRLEWVDDATNASDAYQRNRIRRRLAAVNVDTGRLAELRARQLQLRRDIAREIARLLPKCQGSRYALTHCDEAVATELLAADIEAHGGARPARPHLLRALLAIKTARAGTTHQIAAGVSLRFSTRKYDVEVL